MPIKTMATRKTKAAVSTLSTAKDLPSHPSNASTVEPQNKRAVAEKGEKRLFRRYLREGNPGKFDVS
jgi:hypothetical protein